MITGGCQRTIARPVTIRGAGLHSGAPAVARLLPAPAGAGIAFLRADVAGATPIPARLEEVVATARSIVLGGSVRVATVEHLMSAACGLGIENLLVEVEGEELPCGDGSALIFVEALGAAGTVDQDAPRVPLVLDDPVWASEGGSMIAALPSERFRVTYVVTAGAASMAPQMAEFREGVDDYAASIAPARTWGVAAEIEALRAQGMARGVSLETVLAIGPDGFLNEPRFPNEMARHKILDAIGDLALLGRPVRAHVVAVRAGHGLHVALAREIARRFGDGRDATGGQHVGY
ncbi:MAG: UDP-3-O-acyl-N-acetylglucosamine deacetylase [bacterium]|nr:UDP-3-O-acyl-N-acetylglucosamine deacetylase [bacterium]